MTEYTEETIKRFEDPKHAGKIEETTAVGQVGNTMCGDVMKVYLEIDEDKTIKKARFKTYGCIAAIASSDKICELVEGKTTDEALKITEKQVIKELGDLPPLKHHCSLLGLKALKKAIRNHEEKHSTQ